MLTLALAAIHLFNPAHLLPHRAPASVRSYEQKIKDWRVDIRDDRFAGRSSCTLFVGRYEGYAPVAYEAGRVVFRFRSATETRDAWYRVDGGPPQSAAADLLPKPVRYNATATLDSSTGGYVFIPAPSLLNARTVEIRPNSGAPVRRVRIEGLGEALDYVRARGCTLQAVD